MTTTAYTATSMTEIRGEPSGLWPSYGGSSHLPNRMGSMDSIHGSASSHLSSRPRGEMEHPYSSYSRYPQDDSSSYERSYPGVKRTFAQSEQPAYQEIIHDMRDEGTRITMNQEHKLLYFRRSHEKSTVVDQHGRVQHLELSAQLHGMFFLSEMPASSNDSSALQPELTCYRRNLFQISGSLVMPRGQLSVVNEANETRPVNNLEVSVSAIESVDGNPVRLIVIPWKTPPPNSPEISQGPDQEPSALPLIPFDDGGSEGEGEFAVYPIGWRRLQFRIATANNGRRKELQQHFVLHLKVFGTLPDNTKVTLAEAITSPIVVRGRSPRNFQARKEIPLLGSSAGSRGQALVETGVGVVASALSLNKDGKARSMDMQVPRSDFSFTPKSHNGGMNAMRSNSYPSWHSQVSSSMAPDSYSKLPLSGSSSFSNEAQEIPIHSSISPTVPLPLTGAEHGQSGLRSPYSYAGTSTSQIPGSTVTMSSDSAFNMPRYMDGNPRPSKSPRHQGQQSVEGPDYRYNNFRSMSSSGVGDVSPGGAPSTGRDYYPSSSTWTTTAGESNSSLSYASHDGRAYSGVAPLKHETPSYNSSARASFDSMNNYSWTPT
ncbi:related to acid phosphatase [Claviceps purpurea 20.1]|uniref:Related to acid phosphatase n=1 Tax=Claviceps purpurea (strain 20.1) TaxID=1111077 RepID=M1VYX0_CLAP2|nr:related to acid phosphatase [Claviceps purpurea 20.1]